MKYTVVPVIFMLNSMVSYACDETIKSLLLNARTDQNYIASLSSIRSINLDHNSLDDATLNTALTEASNLVKLSVQHNKLHNPQPVSCEFLTMLELNNGTIEILRIGDWVIAMPNLQILNAAHNKIHTIAADLDTAHSTWGFCGRTVRGPWRSKSLQELDLSHNELTTFDLNIVNNASKLIKADFSHNKIAEIIIPHELNHRKICTVQLHNTMLDDTAKGQLTKCNIRETKLYENRKNTGSASGTLAGILPAAGTTIGIVFGTTGLLPVVANIFLGVGSVVVTEAAFMCVGYNIGKCTVPENKRTYKPFIFVLESADKKDAAGDDILVTLDDE